MNQSRREDSNLSAKAYETPLPPWDAAMGAGPGIEPGGTRVMSRRRDRPFLHKPAEAGESLGGVEPHRQVSKT